MTRNDWQDAGDRIRDLVQDAVDSKDFSELSGAIADVVNDTVNGLQEVLQDSIRSGRTIYMRDRSEYTNVQAADRIKQNLKAKRAHAADRAKVPVPVKVKGEIAGSVMKWTGIGLGGMFGVAAFVLAAIWAGSGVGILSVPTIIMLGFCGAGFGVGMFGSGKVKMAKRYRKYMDVLGDKTYCLVEELAAAVGKSESYVRKDLKKMFELGLFPQGYLSGNGSLLITDQTTYQHYTQAQADYERRNEQGRTAGAQQAQATEPKTKLSPECQEIIDAGQKYIAHIHACNERIPGKEITEKLDRLELVITRIFRETERNPQAVSELKKLMTYYLPTTIKLLDAYCEMDAQPIRGQNIDSTKREIETALDTINAAFENLLDGMFRDEAWDISSDISVLNTMLAQEGLTQDQGMKSTGMF